MFDDLWVLILNLVKLAAAVIVVVLLVRFGLWVWQATA